MKKLILWPLITLIVVVVILVGFAPMILSTSWGTQWLVNRINIDGKIEVASLRLGWMSNQEASGIVWTAPDGKPLFSCQQITSEISIIHLLRQRFELGKTDIVTPQFWLYRKTTKTPQETAPSQPTTKTTAKKSIFPAVSGDIHLSNGQLIVYPDESSSSSFKNIELLLTLPDSPGTLALLDLSGISQQNDKSGTLHIAAKMRDIRSQNMALSFQELVQILALKNSEDLKLDLQITSFPVQTIDAIWSCKSQDFGFLTALFGPYCDAKGAIHAAEQGLQMTLQLLSDNVKANLKGASTETTFVLDPNSRINATITPLLLQRLSQMKVVPIPFDIKQDAPVTLDLQSLTLPLDDSFEDKGSLSFTLSLPGTVLETNVEGLNSIEIKESSISATTAPNSHSLILNASTRLQVQGQLSGVELAIKTTGFPTLQTLPALSFNAQINNFPTLLIAVMIKEPIPLHAALGNRITAQISGDRTPQSTTGSLSLLTPYLEIKNGSFTIDQTFHLNNPLNITWQVSKEFTSAYPSLEIQEVSPLNIQIKKLSIPAKCPLIYSQIEASASIATDRIRTTTLTLKNTKIDLAGSNLAKLKITAHSQASLNDSSTIISKIAGNSHTIDLTSLPQFKDNHLMNMAFRLIAKSDRIDADIKGEWIDQALQVTSPLLIEGRFKEDLYTALFPNRPKLSIEPFIYHLQIDPFTLSFDPLRLNELSGELHSSTIVVKTDTDTVTIKEVGLDFQAVPTNAWAELSFLTAPGNDKFDVEMMMTHYNKNNEINLKNARIALNTHNSLIPIPIAEALLGKGGELTPFLGKRLQLDCQLNVEGYPMRQASIDLHAKGDGLSANGSFDIDDHISLYDGPAELSWTVTPERFLALQNILQTKQLVQLKDASTLTASITAFRWPFPNLSFWFIPPRGNDYSEEDGVILLEGNSHSAISENKSAADSQKIVENEGDKPKTQVATGASHPDDYSLSLKFQADPIALEVTGTKDSALLKNWNLAIDAENLNHPAQIVGGGEIVASDSDTTGMWSIKGQFEDLINEQQTLSVDNLTTQLNLHISQLATNWLLNASFATETIRNLTHGLLGNRFSGELDCALNHLQGPVKATLASDNCQMSLIGNISQGVLTLSEPFTLSAKLNQELSSSIFEEINPLFIGVEGAKNPITLAVHKDGFSVPVKNFDMSKVQIDYAIFDPGILYARSEGNIESLLKLLKAPPKGGVTTIWCTPILFHMKNGTVTYDRMDALVENSAHIASWGKVDFVKESVNMKLGLPNDTLVRMLGLRGIPSKYMVIVSMRGPFGNVKIDWASASTQIASSIAQLTGPSGFIVGRLFDFFSREMGKNKPPPPTFQPFPWEKE